MANILTPTGWKPISESTEERLDELSNDLLARYADRATMQFGQDAYDAGETKYDSKRTRLLKRVKRRKDGLKLAISKLASKKGGASDIKESTEEQKERAYNDGYEAHNDGVPRSKVWHQGHKKTEYDTNQWLDKQKPLKESNTSPGYEELEDAADTIIKDILPDLKQSLDSVGEKDLHGAAVDHLNDRLYSQYPKANSALRHKAVETVVNRYLSKPKKFRPHRKLVTPHPLPLKPKLPRKKKEKEQAWNKVGFKSKSDKPPISGRGSHGKAKYALEEDHSPLRKIISLLEARRI